MWSPVVVAASSRVSGRFLWPLTRRFASSNGVASRSFGTGKMTNQNDGCTSATQSSMCKPKPPPCQKRPCPAPCHACPAQDPCWHCPYTPPKCLKRKPCCPICPTEPSPYQYQGRRTLTTGSPLWKRMDDVKCGKGKCVEPKCNSADKCKPFVQACKKPPVKQRPCKRDGLKCIVEARPEPLRKKCPKTENCEDNCCPPTDLCKKNCVSCDPPPPPPRRLTRCELPGAVDDPCCSRKPKCPNPCLKPGEEENPCKFSDCPDKPEPPDPCNLDGEICSEDDCQFKKKERCCSQVPADCCPRMQKNKQKKKREIKRACCIDLDPNWPPKRQQCSCDFPPKQAAPCQQQLCKKKEFWDGLC